MNRATQSCHVRRKALVVFHVTSGQVFRGSVVKLCEQIGWQFAQRVDQHIEAAPVGHANHNFLYALGTGLLNQLVHRRNKALTTFE